MRAGTAASPRRLRSLPAGAAQAATAASRLRRSCGVAVAACAAPTIASSKVSRSRRRNFSAQSCGCPISLPRSSRAPCADAHSEFARVLNFDFLFSPPISSATTLRRMRDAMHGCYVQPGDLRLVVRDAGDSQSRRGPCGERRRHRRQIPRRLNVQSLRSSASNARCRGSMRQSPALPSGASCSHRLTRRRSPSSTGHAGRRAMPHITDGDKQ